MQNKRHIFSRLYFPGLISLVFLPVMCIGYLYIDKIQKFYRMEVLWADDDDVKLWTASVDFNYKTDRKFTDLSLTGDELNDSRNLIHLQQKIKAFEAVADTINGYSVTFTPHAKYANMVQAFDICTQVDPQKMSLLTLKNQIFVWQTGTIKKSENSNQMFCGTVSNLRGDVIELKADRSIASVVTDFREQFLYNKIRLLAFFTLIALLIIIISLAITGKRKFVLFADSN